MVAPVETFHQTFEGVKLIPDKKDPQDPTNLLVELYQQLADSQFHGKKSTTSYEAILDSITKLEAILAQKNILSPVVDFGPQQQVLAPQHKLFALLATFPRSAKEAKDTQWQAVANLLPAVKESLQKNIQLQQERAIEAQKAKVQESAPPKKNGNGKKHIGTELSTVVYQAPAVSSATSEQPVFVPPKIDENYLFDRAALDYWLFFD